MLMMLFQEVDIDGSQTVEKEELKSYFHKYGYTHITDEYLNEKFKKYCYNKEHMTFEEFRQLHLDDICV